MPEVANPTRQLIEEEEGRVPYVYPDSLGFDTIAVGHLVDKRKGGNLPNVIIDALLDWDIVSVRSFLVGMKGYSSLNAYQRASIDSMAFQLGKHSFEAFTDFIGYIAKGDVKRAATCGRDSLWDHQTHSRAEREMKMLESGVWVPRDMK